MIKRTDTIACTNRMIDALGKFYAESEKELEIEFSETSNKCIPTAQKKAPASSIIQEIAEYYTLELKRKLDNRGDLNV